MQRIALLSDTHAFFDTRFYELFACVDQIWHAGDIGSEEVLDMMVAFKPVRAVYGNVDDANIRLRLPEMLRFDCEGVDVLMTHIGGYPGRYDARIQRKIFANPPRLFISGHSHILKIMNDSQLGLLHINPGAAGKFGFHTIQTAVRFVLDKGTIKDMEVIELVNGELKVENEKVE
ncbi:MAG: metallophosphatase family protein [Cytophagaceae bacterium]|jgi:putative phosphoesterase|nr:metallophosphatase family protein [Cytophagaceae bacterium]